MSRPDQAPYPKISLSRPAQPAGWSGTLSKFKDAENHLFLQNMNTHYIEIEIFA
jgi:hypothetical protein